MNHSETPGLGAKSTEPEWQAQFKGKALKDALAVTKQDPAKPNEIKAITAATITSRAVVTGVNAAREDYMKNHAAIIRPKFEAVLETLEKELGELGIASWSKPVGGYFISFNAEKGCAKAIVAKCKEAGLVLTGAGAAYPYGNDPEDSNIRIAPTLPPIEELKVATDLFVTCTKLVTVEKFLSEME